MAASPIRARRIRWEELLLLAFALSAMAIGGIGAIAQRRASGADQTLSTPSTPSVPGAGMLMPTAARPVGNARRVERAATATPRFDEFAVRMAVNRVPAPAGTGLPGIESIIINPESVLPLTVNLRVAGVDNPAWKRLTTEEQFQYADQILRALVATYPEVETHHRWNMAYFSVNIVESFVVAGPLEPANPDSPFVCSRARNRGLSRECSGPGIGAIVTVPARQRE